jgi:hypothetical protein
MYRHDCINRFLVQEDVVDFYYYYLYSKTFIHFPLVLRPAHRAEVMVL